MLCSADAGFQLIISKALQIFDLSPSFKLQFSTLKQNINQVVNNWKNE